VLGDAIEEARAFPGSRPQHLMVTLLGDYWYQRQEPVSAAALADLLAEFGVTGPSARAAFGRLARRGLLEPVRDGRDTRYRLTPQASGMLAAAGDRIFAFGRQPRSWDGTWTWVSFAIPESMRSTGNLLRRRLRWLNFAPARDAVWMAPRDLGDAAAAVIAELGVTSATITTGPMRDAAGGDPLEAWDLQTLRRRYEAFVSRFAPVCERARRQAMGYPEALLARTAAIDIWRTFPALDPELPAELMPPGWPLRGAAEVFCAVYDGLGPAAASRVRRVLARHDPDAAELVTYHTSRDIAPELSGAAAGRPGAPRHGTAGPRTGR
jgi:phenylacetic acid degradation operon negative regulatory protein